jgi:ATP-dependent RNA helicase DeaD
MSLEPIAAPTSAGAPATFASLGLSADLLKAVEAMGYKEPTNVQRDVWASACAGRDLLVQSRTGTGKTAAFSMPLVDKLVAPDAKLPQALILCPTRELAIQVAGEIERLAQFKGTRVTTLYGGAPMGSQIADLETGVAIVVGTPGRVLDHLRRGTFDPSALRALVLDEADEMLSMGFARELDAIQERLPSTRQTLLFSATVPPEIERMAKNKLRDPEFVTLSGDHAAALTITHIVYMALGDKHGDLLRLLEIEDPESAIVFCNTKGETERVAETLRRAGFPADWLNGDLEQKERERVMQRLRDGKTRFLVATDVAARGIDVSHVTHVINMDFPESPEAYLHRTGRTGRAGRTGTAISLIGAKDVQHLYALRLVYKLRPIEKQLPSAHEMATRAEADVVRFFVDAYADQRIAAPDLALARRLLSHDEAERVVAALLREHLGTRAELGHDVPGEAADARRAKLPPPVEEPKHEAPRVERAERAAADGGRDADRPRRGDRPARDRGDRPARDRGERKPRARASEEVEPGDDLAIVARIEGEEAPVRLEVGGAGGEGHEGGAGDRAPLEDFRELFVNVGRRDGLKAGELVALVTGEGGVSAADVGHVRVRDTSSFLAVRAEHVDRAIEVLAGQVVNGRAVQAERARRSSRSGG